MKARRPQAAALLARPGLRSLVSFLLCSAALVAVPFAAEARTHHPRAARRAHAQGEHAERVDQAEPGSPLTPLSARDARAYTSAFAATRDGRFAEADQIAKKISNPLLMGRLGYARLMHPDYVANYDELSAWLERYRDQAGADAIYALARKKKTAAAAPLPEPDAAAGSEAPIWARVESLAQRYEASAPRPAEPAEPAAASWREPAAPTNKVDASLQAAREAFYKGEVEKALGLAVKAGDRWIAGLAAYRLKRFDEARTRFAALAEDETQNEWVRSGAGYWAARAAIGAGAPEAAPKYLQLAAKTPYTFYGLISERALGLDSAVTPNGLDPALAPSPVQSARGATVAHASESQVAGLIRGDKRARRAAAFAQLGMTHEAGAELRAGLVGAAGERRQGWLKLGLTLNAPLTSPQDLSRGSRVRFDLAQYPTPELSPDGGFTLDKALVYALVRQESRFDASAASAAGAYGLMQLTPETAARVAGDDKLKRDPQRLKNPALNLRLGQDYVARLLTALNGDLLHAIAAYNSGPGVIQKTLGLLGKNADSLLAIESMPAAQTRDFVEKVAANYWIYRNLFGEDSPSLDAAASGRKAVAAALDQPKTVAEAKPRPQVLAGFLLPN